MKYLLALVRMFQDILADNTRKKISENEVSVCCDNLAQIIAQNYRPDIVVAIDTGGFVPGELIAKVLNIPVVHIIVRRDIKITRRYNLDPIPWRWIMSLYHHYLFQTVRPVISSNIAIDISGKIILIVDDSLHTGATIDVSIDYLKHADVLDIKIATLAYVAKRKPDFSILPRGNYSFPWSKDYDKSQT